MQEKFSVYLAILIILFTAVSTAVMVSRLVESVRNNQCYEQLEELLDKEMKRKQIWKEPKITSVLVDEDDRPIESLELSENQIDVLAKIFFDMLYGNKESGGYDEVD